MFRSIKQLTVPQIHNLDRIRPFIQILIDFPPGFSNIISRRDFHPINKSFLFDINPLIIKILIFKLVVDIVLSGDIFIGDIDYKIIRVF